MGEKKEMGINALVSLTPALTPDASGNVRPPLFQGSGLNWACSSITVSSLAPMGLCAVIASCCC